MDVSSNSQSAKVDLWDSDWPSGRYYWTVMPVDIVPDQVLSTVLALPVLAGATTITVANATGILAGDPLQIGSPFSEHAIVQNVVGNDITLTAPVSNFHSAGETVIRPSGGVKYRDAELTQDSCAAGRKLDVRKVERARGDRPVGAVRVRPLTFRQADQRAEAQPEVLRAAARRVAADARRGPVRGAVEPQGLPVEDGRQPDDVRNVAHAPAHSGTWFYRVRGIDSLMIGPKPQLSWSSPVRLAVTKPRFKIVH